MTLKPQVAGGGWCRLHPQPQGTWAAAPAGGRPRLQRRLPADPTPPHPTRACLSIGCVSSDRSFLFLRKSDLTGEPTALLSERQQALGAGMAGRVLGRSGLGRLARGAPRTPAARAHQSMMLVDSAAENPRTLKLISVAVHSARPPMTGTRERLTSSPERTTQRPGCGWPVWSRRPSRGHDRSPHCRDPDLTRAGPPRAGGGPRSGDTQAPPP